MFFGPSKLFKAKKNKVLIDNVKKDETLFCIINSGKFKDVLLERVWHMDMEI